ncbi:protein angel-like isoform X2 [Battus philenor]|uniref:protein angel-like isoform X2 n=1 Tax=Battus philenor TaxID=42288 RepID=UPI0035CFA0F9
MALFICLCLKPTCENIGHALLHVNFSQPICRSKSCISIFSQNSTLIPFTHNNQQWRLLANIRKRLRTKKHITNLNVDKIVKPMSDSLQPTFNHVSYGGQFQIEEKDESESWIQFEGSGSTANGNISKKTDIPSDFRIWEPVEKWNDYYKENSFKFKIVSYNVLAQYLLECHPYLYTQCSPQDLKWHVRAARLYDEILSLEPDILCLQEVQVSHIKSFYSKFEDIGYCGIFKQKTGHRQDGCAIYFKRSMFHLEDHISVEFYQPELPLLNRDNVGMALRLVPKGARAPATPLVVATTHLLYNPKRTDVRLAQIQLFLAEIDRFAYYQSGKKSGHLPIILTGDMNSPPESAVIKLLSRGHVRASPFRDNSDWRKIGVTDSCQHISVYLNRLKGIVAEANTIKIFNSERDGSGAQVSSDAGSSTGTTRPADANDHSALFNSGELDHGLRLASVYPQRKTDGAREATTFQDCWLTVDYIYFSRCSSLRLLERLRLPTDVECEDVGPLPNQVYASDHLALAALFELTTTNTKL